MPYYEPGSIGFCHGTGFLSRVIRLGERMRFRTGSFWNHVFIVSDEINVNGEQLVIQALGSGVDGSKPLTSVASGGRYEIVVLPEHVETDDVVAFAKAQIGDSYGWLSIFGTALRIIMPRWFPLPYLRTGSTWYCSALGAESARAGGWIHKWPDIYNVVPSELYAALKGMSMVEFKVALTA